MTGKSILKSQVFLALLIVWCAEATLTTPAYSQAGGDLRIAELAGQYIAAADVNERVQRSACSRYIKKPNPLTQKSAIDEVKSRMTGQKSGELEEFVRSEKFKRDMRENQEFVDTIIREFKMDGEGIGFACGMLIGLTTAQNQRVFAEWKRLR